MEITVSTSSSAEDEEADSLQKTCNDLGRLLQPDYPLFKNRHYPEFAEIILTDNKTIRELNLKFRDKDEATDVLTFAYESEPDNEVYVSVEYARDQSKTHNNSLRAELALLTVHGIIHTTGLDHENSEEDLEETRYWEQQILDETGFAGTSPLSHSHTLLNK